METLESILRTFVELHPEDAARAYESQPDDERVKLFKTMPVRLSISLMERVSPPIAA